MRRLFDAHCDTLTKILEYNSNLKENNFQVSLDKMRNINHTQVFAIYLEKELNKKIGNLSPFTYFEKVYKTYKQEIEKNSDLINHCNNLNDIENTLRENKTASLLSIEGGEILEGKIENLEKIFEMGVKIITLTWKNDNEIAGSINTGNDLGLTSFGELIIKKMNELHLIIDVSHLSEKAFWQVLKISKEPIIASHSNVKAIANHQRNLSEKQIKAIINNDGWIGINFNREFLTTKNTCSKYDIINHIDHIFKLSGKTNIGFGSDFDGISEWPTDVYDISKIIDLKEILIEKNYKDEEIEDIFCGNFFRLL